MDQKLRWAKSGDCLMCVPGFPHLPGCSFQGWVVGQTVKLGGIGLRSLVDTSYVTYIGAVEQVIPHIVGVGGEEGLAPHLKAVIGIVEGAGRWQQFLQSGSRTAAEFQQSWETLNREALVGTGANWSSCSRAHGCWLGQCQWFKKEQGHGAVGGAETSGHSTHLQISKTEMQGLSLFTQIFRTRWLEGGCWHVLVLTQVFLWLSSEGPYQPTLHFPPLQW